MAGCLCLRQRKDEVSSLDYRHSSLDYIPSDVFRHERTLEELYIDANRIKELPRELFCCHGLKKLSLGDNEIRSIPPAIASLIHLEELDISKNGVVSIPDNIKFCKYLRVIEASVNPLGKLPEGFTQLHGLTELFLNDAFLDFLPGSFGRLSKLKILEIRENHLKTLPRSMSHMTLLQRLDIGNNDFTELPDVVGTLSCLLELWADSNQLKCLPSCVGNLTQLMFLDASKNRIETIPSELEGCVALADLHLSINLLQQLPESLGRLSNLTTLKIDDNRLTSLPFAIGGMVSLSELNVSANDLVELPPSIGLLRHLRTVYADENFIAGIPPEIGSCTGITVLSLRSNNLKRIPDEIGRIPRLRVLNLSDNKINHLPYSLTRLKELQALWLAENQTKPLIRLQTDLDSETGQRSLTCYLLPQQPSEDKDDMYSETGSFHPSLWEEERAERQQIHFEFADAEEEEGKLRRQPTPYPKEMKQRLQHMRNLALKELNIPNAEAKAQGTNTQTDKVVGRRDSPQKSNAGVSTEQTAQSPMTAHRHHLLHADKEKLQRDKSRMQQSRHSQGSTQGVEHKDDGGFLSDVSHRRDPSSGDGILPRAISLDRNISAPPHLQGPDSKSSPSINDVMSNSMQSAKNSVSYQEFLTGLAAKGIHVTDENLQPGTTRSVPVQPSRHHDQHSHQAHYHNYHPMQKPKHRRGSGYDSDFGYRSDVGYRNETGYLSETGYHSDYAACRRRGGQPRSAYPYYPSDTESRRSRSHRDGSVSDHESYSRSSRGNSWVGSQNGSAQNGVRYRGHSSDKHGVSYSNAPMSHRTTIRNDEMYEQHPKRSSNATRPSVTRSRSTGEEIQYPRTINSSRSDSFQKSLHSEPTGGDTHSSGHHPNDQSRVQNETIVSREDDQWKDQLLKASMQLQKSPSTERPRKPADLPARASITDQTDGSIHVMKTPPYRPTPPYAAPHTASQHSLYSNGDTQRSHTGQADKGQEQLTNGDSPSSHKNRPNTLPIADGRSPRSRRQVYHSLSTDRNSQEHNGTLNRSRPDISVNTDCSTVDNNHNSPYKTHQTNERTPARHNPVSGEGASSSMQGPGPPQTYPTTPQKYPQSHSNTPLAQSHPHTLQAQAQSRTPQKGSQSPWKHSNYEKDVALYKQLEPPSQVSSSTDSGYGQLFERTLGEHNRSSVSTSGQPSPAGQISHPGQANSGKHVFHVNLTKNPGLGFSIAGGVGSPGNPFRPSDLGIFITRVQHDGPGAGILKAADKILEVNGVNFLKLEHTKAVDALRHSGLTVSMVIERL